MEFRPNIVREEKSDPLAAATDTSDPNNSFCSISSNETITTQYFMDILVKSPTEKYSVYLDDQTEADDEVTIFTMGLTVSFFLQNEKPFVLLYFGVI